MHLETVDEVVEAVRLQDVVSAPAASLSHGRSRRLEIAIALASRPRLLLLDEPLSGMGVDDIAGMESLLRALVPQHTVVLVEHNMPVTLAIADQVSVLVAGAVLTEGNPFEVAADEPGPGCLPRKGIPVTVLDNVTAYYGRSQVLHGIDLQVRRGETVAVLGRNGVGKTTTLKSILGLVDRRGRITFEGHDITRSSTHAIPRSGIRLVPENRGIFAAVTVEENLRLASTAGAAWSVERVLDTFPRLAERRANHGDRLSGGEQQMLAIARALVAGPKLMLLDEPSEGLAPVIVEQIADVIRTASEEGVSILLVEQRLDLCLALADRLYVMETGAVVFEGSVPDFEADPSIKNRYLTLEVEGS